MSILTVENLGKEFADRLVLDGVTFRIDPGDRVGLIGANGSGKSTLLKIMVGEMNCDHGDFWLAPHTALGYLPQSFEPLGTLTVSEWLKAAQHEILDIEAQLAKLSETMSTHTGVALEQILETYGELAMRFEQRGGYDLPHRVQAVLQGLDVADIACDRRLSSLSGGERVRLGLAAVLIRLPDLLLLDEPGNHLDAPARTWLQRYLAAYSGALIVVSHDRGFLNGVVNRILEVDEFDHHIRSYPGDYDAYCTQKRIERQHWEARYAEEQTLIQGLKRRIQDASQQVGHHRAPTDHNKMAYKGHGARVERATGRKIQAAEVQLHKVLTNAVPCPPEPLRFTANFAGDVSLPEIAVSVSDICAVLETGRILFHDVRLTLRQHQRLLITGPNGMGKSTLLDMIAGRRKPQGGQVFLPSRTVIGYLRQDLVCPNPEATVLEIFREGIEGTLDEQIGRLLSYQLFRFEELRWPCKSLSPGQYRRLMIARLMASGANLLLLDEPTNHISFSLLEEFEQALNEFPGAIIAVSHDRRFIERFQGSVGVLSDGSLIFPAAQALSEADKARMVSEIQNLSSYQDVLKGRGT